MSFEDMIEQAIDAAFEKVEVDQALDKAIDEVLDDPEVDRAIDDMLDDPEINDVDFVNSIVIIVLGKIDTIDVIKAEFSA